MPLVAGFHRQSPCEGSRRTRMRVCTPVVVVGYPSSSSHGKLLGGEEISTILGSVFSY